RAASAGSSRIRRCRGRDDPAEAARGLEDQWDPADGTRPTAGARSWPTHVRQQTRCEQGPTERQQTTWEVHPVTEFYVCRRNSCASDDLTQWELVGKVQ